MPPTTMTTAIAVSCELLGLVTVSQAQTLRCFVAGQVKNCGYGLE
jgi:hypothetical protein